jgi:hypothetical protein
VILLAIKILNIFLTLYNIHYIVSECLDVQLSELGRSLFSNIKNFLYHIYLFINLFLEFNEICQDVESSTE